MSFRGVSVLSSCAHPGRAWECGRPVVPCRLPPYTQKAAVVWHTSEGGTLARLCPSSQSGHSPLMTDFAYLTNHSRIPRTQLRITRTGEVFSVE